MADKWDKQLMQLLRRTGEELKRSGEELRVEAQRLLTEVRDPANQAKVRAGVEELKTWAKQAGREATELLETTVRKVEGAVESTFQSRAGQTAAKPAAPATADAAAAPAPARAGPAAKKAPGKTIGKKAASRPTRPATGGGPKPRPKTVGKRKRPASP